MSDFWKIILRVILFLAICAVMSYCYPTRVEVFEPVIIKLQGDEKVLLDSINTFRERLGLPAFIPEEMHYKGAQIRNLANAELGTISHNGIGIVITDLRKLGITKVGETLAYRYTKVESVYYAWLNNPGHEKILKNDYIYAGPRIYTDSITSIKYYCLILGK